MANGGRGLQHRFGRLLRQLREASGMSQEVLASRAGVSRTSVVNIERGRQGVSLATLYRLAEALNCAPSSLLPDLETSPAPVVLIGSANADDREMLAAIQRRAGEEDA